VRYAIVISRVVSYKVAQALVLVVGYTIEGFLRPELGYTK